MKGGKGFGQKKKFKGGLKVIFFNRSKSFVYSFSLFFWFVVNIGLGKVLSQEPDYWRASVQSVIHIQEPVAGIAKISNPYGQNQAVLKFYKMSGSSVESNPSFSLPLPFHRPGIGFAISRKEIVICGYHYSDWTTFTGKGKLLSVQFGLDANNAVEAQITNAVDLPLYDPIKVLYLRDAKKLIFLDHKTRTILGGDWGGVGTNFPSTFSAIADESQVPILRFYPNLFVGQIVGRKSLGVSAFSADDYFKIAMDSQGNWDVHSFSRTSSTEIPIVILGGAWLSQTHPLMVKASSGDYEKSWQLVRKHDQAYVNGGLLSLDSLQALPMQEEFRVNPGSEYFYEFSFKGGTEKHKVTFVPFARYGDPVQGNGVKVGRCSIVGIPSVGSQNFGVSAFIKKLQANAHVTEAFMNVSQRNPDGTDPVDMTGSQAILIPNLSIPFSFDINTFKSSVGIRFPIDSEPSLDGTVFLFQFVLNLDNGETVYSDVIGVRIHPSTGEGEPLAAGYSFASKKKVSSLSGYRFLKVAKKGGQTPETAKIWKSLYAKMKKARK